MANIVREDQEKLTTQITINLVKEDYQPKVDSELKKLRKKVNLKGFRAGKVPVSYVKKIYGKQVLAEQINNVLSEELTTYLTDNKLNILGQPLPVEEEVPNLDADNIEDLSFKYEIGLAPEFELQGLDDSTTVSKHAVEVDDDRLQEELDKILKQFGAQSNPETIEETDMVNFSAEELEFAPKAEPFTKDISFAMDLIPTKTLRKKFLGKGIGDSIEVKDIF
ncbi:MAG: trigger factor family protein, partial [Bacteroidota bacterium]